MKKTLKTFAVVSAMSIMAVAIAGCGSKNATQSGVSQIDTPLITDTADPVYKDDSDMTTTVKDSILKKMDGETFYFSSGAGGWATELKVYADGTFEGHYYDSDMGDRGNGYPNGTQYDSEFKGKFSVPEQVNNYSYSMKVENVETDKMAGTEEIKDGVKYVYTEPVGIKDGAKLHIYIPGASVSSLPEGYISWAQMSLKGDDKLTFYGIYNEKDNAGFVGNTTIRE